MGLRDNRDKVEFKEVILDQKKVACEIVDAIPMDWTAKEGTGEFAGKKYRAMKLQINITDPSIQTENSDARPKTLIDDVMNLERFPYVSKEDGSVQWLRTGKLYQLEKAFGFDPCFEDADGNDLEPYVTRTGNKVAPKVDGVRQKLNPDFVQAYFNEDDSPKTLEWAGKKIRVDIGTRKSEQFGDKNTAKNYHPY